MTPDSTAENPRAARHGGTMLPRLAKLAYGGDYNPEQWPESVWAEDVALMREAGVNLVSVGIFSWALLEPAEGRYEFGWLDRVIDLLHDNGVAVDLATATASPPPWFSKAYPDSLPVTSDGRRMWPGGRQAYCPSSPAFRTAAAGLAKAMATRYGDHPALVLWHVNNEYGCHTAHCYCDTSATAFRRWLQRRYGDLDGLNAAWGTSFWSQHYYDWDEINPPRLAPTFVNPTQQLDYWRFSSDELLDCFRAERDVLRRVTPNVPITTNFMAPRFKALDYWAWAAEIDVISNDHYLIGTDPLGHVDLSMSADLTRSLAGGRPWMLMEHSTSAVNWQPVNVAKATGQLRRNSLAHLARGADGILYFQWRAAVAGAEKFHSGMVPHAGTDTKTWREVVALGAELQELADVRDSTIRADVAILFDYSSWWAGELDSHPSNDLSYIESIRAYYDPLWRAGITVDFVAPEADLSGYRLLLAPSLYLVTDQGAATIEAFLRGGGSLLVSFFSGIVDASDHIRPGGYPGAFRELLGVSVEEFFPLLAEQSVALTGGGSGSRWSERVRLAGATEVSSYEGGDLAGGPAVTRNTTRGGTAWYVSTRPDPATLATLLQSVCAEAEVHPAAQASADVEVVRRHGKGRSWLFALNHGSAPGTVEAASGPVEVPAGDVVVLAEPVGLPDLRRDSASLVADG